MDIKNDITFRGDVLDSDIEVVRDMVEASGFFYDEEVEVAAELVEERLSKGDRSGYYFIFAERDGKVVGYVCFGPIACTKAGYDLYWIVVDKGYKGKGLGRELMRRAEEAISRRGGVRVYVETSSRELYDPTRAFYRSIGYSEEAVMKDFYNVGDSKVVYVKILPTRACC